MCQENGDKREEDIASEEGDEERVSQVTRQNNISYPSMMNLCSDQCQLFTQNHGFAETKKIENQMIEQNLVQENAPKESQQSSNSHLLRRTLSQESNIEPSSNKLFNTNNEILKEQIQQKNENSCYSQSSIQCIKDSNKLQQDSANLNLSLKYRKGLNQLTVETFKNKSIRSKKPSMSEKKSPTPSLQSIKALSSTVDNQKNLVEVKRKSSNQRKSTIKLIKYRSEITMEDFNTEMLNENDDLKLHQKINQGASNILQVKNSSIQENNSSSPAGLWKEEYEDEDEYIYDPKQYSSIYQKDRKRMNFAQFFVENEKIQKLCSFLLDKARRNRFSKFTYKDISLINDLAIVISSPTLKEKLCGFCVKIFSIFGTYLSLIPVINPTSYLRVWFDLFILMLSCFYFFVVPIQAAFGEELGQQILPYQINILLSLFLILEILLNISTSYLEKGYLVFDRFKIIQRYLKQRFLLDILLLAAVYGHERAERDPQYQKYKQIMRFMLFLIFGKVNQFGDFIRKIQDRFFIKRNTIKYIKLLRLLFLIIFIAHFFACIWIFTVNIEKQIGVTNTWMHKQNIIEEKWAIKYTNAYYFATVTMITVGFGDITPNNLQEQIVCIFFMFIACGVFAYSINSIGLIIKDINEIEEKKQTDMQTISKYMQKKNIHYMLQYEVREYLEYYSENCDQQDLESQQKIINQLSDNLKTNLLLEANKSALKDNPLFRDNFSEEFISHAVQLISEVRYTPEEFILLEGIPDDSSIYFIEDGRVEILIRQQQINGQYKYQTLCEINPGQYFGQVSFFTGQLRSQSVRSKEFTTLLKIERQEFIDLLFKYPTDQEKYFQIKDKITFGQQFEEIGGNCYNCGNKYHQVNKCPKIHYEPNRFQILCQYRYSQEQERKEFTRTKVKNKYSPCLNVKDLAQCAIDFVSNNYEMLEREDLMNTQFLMQSSNMEQFQQEEIEDIYLSSRRTTNQFQTEQTNNETPNEQVQNTNNTYNKQDEILCGIVEEIEESKLGMNTEDLGDTRSIQDQDPLSNYSKKPGQLSNFVTKEDQKQAILSRRVSLSENIQESKKGYSTDDDIKKNLENLQKAFINMNNQSQSNTQQQVSDKILVKDGSHKTITKVNSCTLINLQKPQIKLDFSDKKPDSYVPSAHKRNQIRGRASSVKDHYPIYEQEFVQQKPSQYLPLAQSSQVSPIQHRLHINQPQKILQQSQRLIGKALGINSQFYSKSGNLNQQIVHQPPSASPQKNLLTSQQGQSINAIRQLLKSQRAPSANGEAKPYPSNQQMLDGIIEKILYSPQYEMALQNKLKGFQEELLNCYIPDSMNLQQFNIPYELQFDLMKSYKNYFPEYNVDRVIDRIKKQRNKQLRNLLLRHQRTLTNKFKYYKKKLGATNTPYNMRDPIQQRNKSEKSNNSQINLSPQRFVRNDTQLLQLKEQRTKTFISFTESLGKQQQIKKTQPFIETILPPLPIRRIGTSVTDKDKSDKSPSSFKRSPTLTVQGNKFVNTQPGITPNYGNGTGQRRSSRKSTLHIRLVEANSPSSRQSQNNSPIMNSDSSSFKLGKQVFVKII